MATLKLGEPLIDAVVAKLQNGYAARVAAINSADTLGITLAVPATGDYYFGGVSEIPRCPAVIVTQAPTEHRNEGEGPHSFVWVADVLVVVLDEDMDRSVLARRLQRHRRAIAEVLWDDDPAQAVSVNGSLTSLMWRADRPGPVADPSVTDSSVWRSTHLLLFEARQQEN